MILSFNDKAYEQDVINLMLLQLTIDLKAISLDIHCLRHGLDGFFNVEQKGASPFAVFLHPLGHL